VNDLVVVCVVEISARPSEFSFVLFVSLIITRDGEPYTKQLYTISTDDYYSESCWTEKQSSEMISFFF
jgi:hypothetical protein